MFSAPPKPRPAATTVSCGIFVDSRLMRELIASWVSVRGGVRLVTRGSRPSEVCSALTKHCPELLIAACTASCEKATEVIRHFVSVNPTGRVIVIASDGKEFVAPHWLKPHLDATFDGSASLNALWTTIETMIVRPRTDGVGSIRRRMAGSPLSPRESRILDLIADGHTSGAIAESLGISEHTVRAHRKRIITKLGVAGSNLMRWAVMLRQTGRPPIPDGEPA